jgi:hypothetical protein
LNYKKNKKDIYKAVLKKQKKEEKQEEEKGPIKKKKKEKEVLRIMEMKLKNIYKRNPKKELFIGKNRIAKKKLL